MLVVQMIGVNADTLSLVPYWSMTIVWWWCVRVCMFHFASISHHLSTTCHHTNQSYLLYHWRHQSSSLNHQFLRNRMHQKEVNIWNCFNVFTHSDADQKSFVIIVEETCFALEFASIDCQKVQKWYIHLLWKLMPIIMNIVKYENLIYYSK